MTRRYLNLTAEAWAGVRRVWQPPLSARLAWQSRVVGPLLSSAYAQQTVKAAPVRRAARRDGALVVVGYWRSGTTLLHELLAASGTWSYPTTQACMNPQSFLLGNAKSSRTVRRPMDDMTISALSPQEDEFALLGLGARSPYEALLFPQHLGEALALADPASLTPAERERWREIFLSFTETVSGSQGGRPLLLKSPSHACRLPLLRKLLPGCRFAVVVREPYRVFESSVRMWREMFGLYALTKIPPEDAIRDAVLANRPHFERALQAGLGDDHALVRHEDLIRDPAGTVAALYRALNLDGGEHAADAAAREAKSRVGYRAQSAPPGEPWATKVRTAWIDVFERYGYAAKGHTAGSN
jgi:omega-hydroxy-beta-dihydromenaquinone-9 sulfotransferase